MMHIGGKMVLRSTGEEVEIIDFQFVERGARTDEDWVTYIDSEGKEHIKEHLNIQLDFKAKSNDIWNKMFDYDKGNKYPNITNVRRYEVAKELVVNDVTCRTVSEAVDIANSLAKTNRC